MATTPRWGLRYPALTDTADVPRDIGNLATDLDGVAFDDQGTAANRPVSTPQAPGKKGRYYWATDTLLLFRDNGTGWDTINPSLAVDGAPGTGTLRTLGPGAQQAAPGNDARLSDQRTPLDASVTVGKVSSLLIPSQGASGNAEALRAIGVAAGQVVAGNDPKLSDARTPLNGSVLDASVNAAAAIAESKLALASDAAPGVASRRTLGPGAQQAPPGNDARFYHQAIQAGVFAVGDFLVSSRGAGANMSVDVAPGSAWTPSAVGRQGLDHGVGIATVNLPVTPADATNPRVDAVLVNCSSGTPQLQVVAGAPVAGATLANRAGASDTGVYPSYLVPYLVLAYVLVPANSTSVVNANIGGFYDPRQPTLGAVVGAPPQYATAPTIGAVALLSAINNQQTGPGTLSMPFAAPAAVDDPDGSWSAGAPTVLSIRRPGVYFVAGYMNAAQMPSGTWCEAQILKNGTEQAKAGVGAAVSFNPDYAPSSLFRCGYGDTIQLANYTSASGSFTHLAASLRAAWQRF